MGRLLATWPKVRFSRAVSDGFRFCVHSRGNDGLPAAFERLELIGEQAPGLSSPGDVPAQDGPGTDQCGPLCRPHVCRRARQARRSVTEFVRAGGRFGGGERSPFWHCKTPNPPNRLSPRISAITRSNFRSFPTNLPRQARGFFRARPWSMPPLKSSV